jgi:hypothetical protein
MRDESCKAAAGVLGCLLLVGFLALRELLTFPSNKIPKDYCRYGTTNSHNDALAHVASNSIPLRSR